MVNFPKMAHLHGTVVLPKKIIVSFEIFTYGNISVALICETSFSCFGHNYTAGSW
jgi:hypothetical protein